MVDNQCLLWTQGEGEVTYIVAWPTLGQLD